MDAEQQGRSGNLFLRLSKQGSIAGPHWQAKSVLFLFVDTLLICRSTNQCLYHRCGISTRRLGFRVRSCSFSSIYKWNSMVLLSSLSSRDRIYEFLFELVQTELLLKLEQSFRIGIKGQLQNFRIYYKAVVKIPRCDFPDFQWFLEWPEDQYSLGSGQTRYIQVL